MRVFYVNSTFVNEAEAVISVMDRGFLMADAIYEVVAVLDGKLLDFDGHWARLERSLAEIGIPNPLVRDELLAIFHELAKRNALEEGSIYLQITRGVAERDFLIAEDMRPSVVIFTQERQLRSSSVAERGLKIGIKPDLRWGRGDIKTTQLLYASLMKTEAVRAGNDDAWLVRDGFITEGTSNNAYVLTKEGVILTPPSSREILSGITRASVLRICEEENLGFEERRFDVKEAQGAREAFLTSAGALVMPVVEIDGCKIGDGAPGAMTQKLRRIYIETALASGIYNSPL